MEGSAKVCVSARSRRERDPGPSQDQQELGRLYGRCRLYGRYRLCGAADLSLERTNAAGPWPSTQDCGLQEPLEIESRTIGLCFGKGLLEVVLLTPQEGKKSEGREPFQTVPCPGGERGEIGHQTFLRADICTFALR